jgi:fucose 4-O-acetylase-like acetyltransferase
MGFTGSKASMSQRISGFDAVKGAAIFAVVFGHVWRGLDGAGLIPNAALFARVDAAIYLFHMPVFFFLSGLFISTQRPFTAFLRNRAILLLWPMVLWGWIDAGLKSAAGIPIKGHVYSAVEVALSALPPVGIFWFLYTLFILHMIAWGLLRLPRMVYMPVMAALAVAASAGWINVSPFDSLWNTVIFLPPFFAGILWANLAGHGALIGKGLVVPGLAAFALGWAVLFTGLPAWNVAFSTLAMALATLGFIAFWANVRLGNRQRAFLLALGRQTMPIYLTHVIFTSVTRMALLWLGVEALTPHLILATTSGILGPLALIWLARRAGLSQLIGFEPPKDKAA